ncbi:MAG: hypothetical protein WA814_00025 [Candidatus Baltobacteraceae bacterium]
MHMKGAPILFALVALAACGGARGGSGAIPPGFGSSGLAAIDRGGSLGPVLSTSDGGQIFGFDIDQNGNDGILASTNGFELSVQTFDQTSGQITRTFGVRKGHGARNGDDYVGDGIFAGDIALIDHQVAGIPGQTAAKDEYLLVDPVTKMKLNGKWGIASKHFNTLQNAVNQSTTTSVVFGYERNGSDPSELYVSDLAKHTSKVIKLNPQMFFLSMAPQLAQDTVNNLAVMATSPSSGAAGGPPPVIATIDLSSGKMTTFSGVACPGLVGCGYANGIAYDSATGIACTTTELDGGVEFYDVAKQTGSHVLMPNGGGQTFAGAYVVNDPVHQLFLIAQPFSSTSPSGSSVQIYDESGTLEESINGLNFTDAGFLVIPVKIAINPDKRIAWVNTSHANQLQEFSY